MTLFCHSFWHLIWKYICHIFSNSLLWHLTFCSGILSDILFWHPIWHPFWHLFWHFLWHSIWHSFWDSTWHLILTFFLASIWHSVWYSNFSKKATWYMPYFLQVYFLTFFPASFLVYLRRLIVVEVWRGTLWSSARGGGPAGNTLIRSLRWRSGGDHFDPEVAVRVRRGTVWSKACSWGPAGMTLIQRLLFGPREHCDLELAVEVRLGTLRSRAYSWGRAEEGGGRMRRNEAGRLT